ncbi:MAG TPA: YdeI/OmpD-associated family protein [Candidatus Thermoplasmatota archaeon]|nr:YdeI/OmpD-associated family protein [Candidatus Thermoplasmatota archaeon]
MADDIPEELRAALAQDTVARQAFERMPPSHRREHARYVAEAKRPETRARRAAKTLETLRSEG